MNNQVPWCALLTISSLLLSASSVNIRSDRVTNFGDWGPMERCPEGSFVKAINVKAESPQGPNDDDTALNAVYLSCVPLDVQITGPYFHTSKVLKSSEARWGHFRGLEYCYRGVAVGFQLRSEDYQGTREDDTAANDMVLICAGAKGISKTQARGETWGSWRADKRCPEKMAICGLETQVEGYQGTQHDDTALNNVGILCCELPNPAAICTPTDDWEEFERLDNSAAVTETKFTVREKIGVQTMKESSQSTSASEEIGMSVGFGASASLYGVLSVNFETKLSKSTKTEHSWTRAESSVFNSETEKTYEIFVPPKCTTTLYKIVGRCGFFVVKSHAVKRVDRFADGREQVIEGAVIKNEIESESERASCCNSHVLFFNVCQLAMALTISFIVTFLYC